MCGRPFPGPWAWACAPLRPRSASGQPRRSLALGLCPRFPGSDSVFLLSGRWEALRPNPRHSQPEALPLLPRCLSPRRGPCGAGLPQATAEPVPGGGLEPFQDGDGFSLLDFESDYLPS